MVWRAFLAAILLVVSPIGVAAQGFEREPLSDTPPPDGAMGYQQRYGQNYEVGRLDPKPYGYDYGTIYKSLSPLEMENRRMELELWAPELFNDLSGSLPQW